MITSRNQGQIFGAKPSLEEFERQLEADPTYKAYNKMGAILTALVSAVKFFKRTTTKVSFALHRHNAAH